jgi:hypothetical protein
MTDQVNVMTTLGQQRKRALRFFVPVATDKRVGKVPITHLKHNTHTRCTAFM